MIRFVLYLLVVVFLVWFSTTVKLGEYTCAGHVKRIWQSDETKDLKEGIKQKATSESTRELVDDVKKTAGPVVERVERGVKSGIREAARDPADDAAKDDLKDAPPAAAQ